MRILSITQNLERGGTQRVAQNFTLEYVRRGHEAAVLAYQGGGVRERVLHEAGAPLFIGGDGDRLEASVRQADAFDPDVIHIHRAGSTNTAEGRLLRRLRTGRRKVVETSHFGRVDESADAELIDAHLQLSRWCLWRWRKWLGARSPRVCGAIVPNPVDVDAFERSGDDAIRRYREETLRLPPGAFLCGRVAQPMIAKWHPATIDAFAELAARHDNAYLVTVGLPDHLRRRVDALPEAARRRVTMMDCIDSDGDLSLLYSSLDVFLHAARFGETFGLVLAEAMLCGAPAVTLSTPHKDNSQSEVVRHGEVGYVALSPKHLGQALLHAYEHPEERVAMAARCRRSIVDRFRMEAVAGRALAVFEHVLDATDRGDLRRRLSEDPQVHSEVSASEIQGYLTNGFGQTSAKERLLMNVVWRPTLYRWYKRLQAVRGR